MDDYSFRSELNLDKLKLQLKCYTYFTDVCVVLKIHCSDVSDVPTDKLKFEFEKLKAGNRFGTSDSESNKIEWNKI